MWWARPSCTSFVDMYDGSWHGWSAVAVFQIPALVYVCGDRLCCRADEESTLIYVSCGSRLAVLPMNKHFFVGSILQVVAFLCRSDTASDRCYMGWGGYLGSGRCYTEYSADVIDVD